MTSDETKQFMQEVFRNVVENIEVSEEIYARYFSTAYVQHVDGKTLDYAGLIAHLKTLKSVLQSVQVTFQYLIVEGDTVASLHRVEAIKRDGTEVKVQVHAFFRVQDKKIISCDELTYLMQGEASDSDLGSRT